jgi:hypothetical protein
MTFDAEDVPIIDNGTFTYSGGDVPLLFGLNGLLLPNGQASGRCIGVTNSSIWGRTGRVTSFMYGSSGWRNWEAVWKDKGGVNALRFLPM